MLLIGSHMEKNDNQNLFGQNQSKISPKIAQRLPKIANFRRIFFPFWRCEGRGRFRWYSIEFYNYSRQNRFIQVPESVLKHRTHPQLPMSYHLKVDFCIQLSVKFQILINFWQQMLDFCLGYSNKKCWLWFLALVFMPQTFLLFCWSTCEVIQPVKTSIFDHRKIDFDWKLACYWPVFFFTRGAQIQFLGRVDTPDILRN